MSFKPVQKLTVTRTLSSGEQVTVGVLAQNRQGVFFSMQIAICNSLAIYRRFCSMLQRSRVLKVLRDLYIYLPKFMGVLKFPPQVSS